MSETPAHLFVYGTLRHGGTAARLLADSERIDAAVVAGTLYNVNTRFPALVLGGSGTVHGELWRCPPDLLPRLDEYESVPEGLFRRVRRQIASVTAWIYVAGPRLAPHLVPENAVAGGRWPL